MARKPLNLVNLFVVAAIVTVAFTLLWYAYIRRNPVPRWLWRIWDWRVWPLKHFRHPR